MKEKERGGENGSHLHGILQGPIFHPTALTHAPDEVRHFRCFFPFPSPMIKPVMMNLRSGFLPLARVMILALVLVRMFSGSCVARLDQPRQNKLSMGYLLRSPFLKAAIIIVAISTVVTHTIIQQNEVDEIAARYKTKTLVMQRVMERLRAEQNVEVVKELRVAHNIFKHHELRKESRLEALFQDPSLDYFSTWNPNVKPEVEPQAPVVMAVDPEVAALAELFTDTEHVSGAFTSSAADKTVSKFL